MYIVTRLDVMVDAPLWRASLYSVSLPAEKKVAKLSCIIEHHDDKCDEKIEHCDDKCDETSAMG